MSPAQRAIRVLPARAVAYFLFSVAIVIACLFLVDRWLLPRMEDDGLLNGMAWEVEDAKIKLGMRFKNKASEECWVWRSDGLPVTEAKQKAKRILVMGDSFVWGTGYANLNDTWWRMLARELQRRGYEDVEIIGAGMQGKNTRQELEAARGLLSSYRPDLVIWGYVTNDPDEKRVRLLLPPARHQDAGDAAEGRDQARGERVMVHLRAEPSFQTIDRLIGPVLPNVDFHIQDLRDRKRLVSLNGQDRCYEYDQWELQLLEGANFAAYRKTVESLGEFQKSAGVPGFVMTLPTWPSREFYGPRHVKVKPLFEAAGVPFFDVVDDFVAAYPDRRANEHNILAWGVNPADSHPGPRTTHFLGVEAANIIEQHYSSCLGERRTGTAPPEVRVNDWLPGNMWVRPGPTTDFDYPLTDSAMLTMPIRKPYVQLNLETPAALKEVKLRGEGLAGARIYLTSVDPKQGYDTGLLHDLGSRLGTELAWNLQDLDFAAAVSTIRISAMFNSPARRLHLAVVPR